MAHPAHREHPAAAPHYDIDRARELLTRTATMPATKHELIIVLTEYRHALHSLLLTTTRPQ